MTDPLAKGLSRREALQLASALVLHQAPRRRRRVLVAGGGIAGLSCAWELQRRGHDVIVLEASERTGGHVYTLRTGLDDGLYVDAGAEQFTEPGYERFWGYVREFDLPYRYYPRRERMLRWLGGRMYSEEMLTDPAALAGLGLNAREIAYLRTHAFWDLASLYYGPYVGQFADEYKPFDAGLNHLDGLTTTELLQKDGASPGAVRLIGGGGSALQSVWHAAILARRGVPSWPPRVFRLVGGNQTLTDTFARKLGERVRLRSPVTRIEHGATGVRVTCEDGGRRVRHEADFVVSAMSAVQLRRVPFLPALPEAKTFAIHNVPYYSDSRPIFQTSSKFWERDGVSPNMEIGEDSLQHVWSTCDEVATTRGLIVGTSGASATADTAAATYRRHYPGASMAIEKALIWTWASHPWASACETTAYPRGQLARFWPALMEPHGRIHFVGAYADNLNWGMEAATRSAHRVAEAIDALG